MSRAGMNRWNARSKYGAVKTEVDGVTFHSKKEARRYAELKLLEKAGEIRALSLQPEFPLWVHTGIVSNSPVPIGKYVADFSYEERKLGQKASRWFDIWTDVIEDVKGFKTPLYRWKKKHVEAQYGIQIREL